MSNRKLSPAMRTCLKTNDGMKASPFLLS
jgi:hypothetical protein